jgi:F-type H+-transporting ATPase subunit b
MLTRFVFSLALLAALAGANLAVAAEGGHGEGAVPGASAPHAPPAGEGSGHGGTVDPLDFQKDLALWTAVVFLVLLAVLGKFAWGPVTEALDKREQRIADQIASAEQANSEARQLLADYHNKLRGSESEVREILERGRREAEDLGRQMLDKTREESELEKQRALREIDAATAGAIKELAERSADLAVELAGKIVHATVDRADHARLIEQAVAGFSKIEPGKN